MVNRNENNGNGRGSPPPPGAGVHIVTLWLMLSLIYYLLFELLNYFGYNDFPSFLVSFTGVNCVFFFLSLVVDYFFSRKYGWSILDKIYEWFTSYPEI